MNVCFEYAYRDAANYKNYGTVIFLESQQQSLAEIEKSIRATLIDEEFFIAEKVNVPTLYFSKFDVDLDHSWHQFSAVSWTDEKANGSVTISDFIQRLKISRPKF